MQGRVYQTTTKFPLILHTVEVSFSYCREKFRFVYYKMLYDRIKNQDIKLHD